MKNASVLVQFALLLIGITLLVFYILPEFREMGEKQDLLDRYTVAIESASLVNETLNRLLQQKRSISVIDQEKLDTYLPVRVNLVAVYRDIDAYAKRRNIDLLTIASSGGAGGRSGANTRVREANRASTAVSVTVAGEYEELKDMLADMDRNNYPLHVSGLDIVSQGDILEATIEFTTYSFNNN